MTTFTAIMSAAAYDVLQTDDPELCKTIDDLHKAGLTTAQICRAVVGIGGSSLAWLIEQASEHLKT